METLFIFKQKTNNIKITNIFKIRDFKIISKTHMHILQQ